MASEAAVVAKMEDFVVGLLRHFIRAGSLYRSNFSNASLLLAGEGCEDGFIGACCLTGMLDHEDRSFEDLPFAGPRSGRPWRELWQRWDGAPSTHSCVVIGWVPRDPVVFFFFHEVLRIIDHH